MQTKLTLRVDRDLVRKAKRYSKRRGKSVSRLVADYFAVMDGEEAGTEEELGPRVRTLLGVLAGSEASEEDYLRHIEEKHL